MENGKDPPNLEVIIKLMGMTDSSHDGEALNAIRMANVQLKKWGWDWRKMLTAKIKIMPDPFGGIPTPEFHVPRGMTQSAPSAPPPPPRQYDDKKEMDKYFDKLQFRTLPDVVQKRINNIERTWNAQGFLLYGDYDFLRTTANKRKF